MKWALNGSIIAQGINITIENGKRLRNNYLVYNLTQLKNILYSNQSTALWTVKFTTVSPDTEVS